MVRVAPAGEERPVTTGSFRVGYRNSPRTMLPVNAFELNPLEPVTQVVFVHDYVQLVFETATLSIYNSMWFRGLQGEEVDRGHTGFADALVGVIGTKACSVDRSAAECLVLQFEGKGRLAVAHDSSGPEAFQFNTAAGSFVMQQNI